MAFLVFGGVKVSDFVYQLWIRGREHGSIRYYPTFDAYRECFLTPPDKFPWEQPPCTALVKEGPKAMILARRTS
jgi:hypothetical protein